MSNSNGARSAASVLPEIDRRTPRNRHGLAVLLRRLRGALGRPLRLERRGLQWHLLLVDRRRSAAAFRPGSEVRLLADLEARLLAIGAEHAAAMRQLVRVHDALKRKGWSAVELFSARDLGRAITQCELLASIDSSNSLIGLAERLRVLKVGAELRDDRRAKAQRASTEAAIEVAEATFDEYNEQEWRLTINLQPEGGGCPSAPSEPEFETDHA
jgi:hypothetical protein